VHQVPHDARDAEQLLAELLATCPPAAANGKPIMLQRSAMRRDRSVVRKLSPMNCRNW
jgi:hypothetical protein